MSALLSVKVEDLIRRAGSALARGEPVLIFDAPEREGETDLVFHSEMATPELVRLARRDAGGLICCALSAELTRRLGLPFASDLLDVGRSAYPILGSLVDRPRYDARSAFGISVNHRRTYTGVPDADRALTLRALGEIARDARALSDDQLIRRFASSFVSPGHVPLIHAAPGLLRERKGHTELSISLARMAGLSESMTVCEMLGDSGGARSPEAARRYAAVHGWIFLDGAEIREAWERWSA